MHQPHSIAKTAYLSFRNACLEESDILHTQYRVTSSQIRAHFALQ